MAKQLLKYVSLCMLALFMCDIGTFAQTSSPEATLDFTDKTAWDIPTDGTNKDLGSYTNGTYTIKLYATTNYKMNNGYLILGKKDSYLELPAFDFDVERIEVVGHSGASTAVKQNIFVGTTAVSTETTGADGVTNTYAIASGNQAAGNIYKLVVTSGHNTQIEAIKIYKKSSGGETTGVATPTFSVSGGKYYERIELSLSCTTSDASIYYTLDGTDPTSASTAYTSAITISETTTVKAIAVSGEQTSEIASATYTFPTAVANIAALADVASGVDVVLTLTDAQVLYVNGTNDVYIKDATGAMDFFKSGLTFTAGQILNGTIIASNSPYNGIYEIKPISGVTNLDNVTVSEGEATPVVMTTAEASESSAYCQLVTINDVTPVADGTKFYTDDTKTLQIYNKYGLDYTLDASKKYSITGMIITFPSGGSILSEIAPTVVPEEVEEPQPVGFRDIKLNLMEHPEVLTQSNVYITVAEDGTIGTTDNADEAAATVKGKVHSSYGSSNFTASVPVEGTVKITYATHDYGNDITVTNAEGETVATLNTVGDKWMSNHDNVVSTYYRVNEPTTLHFSNANYNPLLLQQ